MLAILKSMAAKRTFQTIREQVVNQLRSEILSQVYEPGESLREHSLAKTYGVSRSPIRDALLQLTQEGLLVATPNCGVRVAHKMDERLQPLIVDLRRKIEKFALRIAMKGMNEAGLDLLDKRLEAHRQSCEAKDLPAIVKSDVDFHRAIIELTDMPELSTLWQPVIAGMMLHYERHRGWMESYKEHKAIADAIKAGDTTAAQKALLANIK